MSAKAQVLSFDFMTASFMFLLVISLIYIYWTYASIQVAEVRNMNDMIDKSNTASQAWFREGLPEYWGSSDVIDLGLQNDHRFNQTKMDSLSDIGYERVKTLLGVEGYEYYFRVYEANTTLFEFGLYPSDAENTVRMRRVGILNRSIVFVETVVWL